MRAHLVVGRAGGRAAVGRDRLVALAALAARESSYRVSTFSIGFEERAFNELERARWSPSNTAPTTTSWSCAPTPSSCCPGWREAFDEPFADSSALPTYLVSQLAAGTVKVALSGEGGDELFGGYYTYVADTLAPRIGPVASALRPLVERLPSSSGQGQLDYKAKRFARAAHLPPLERHHGWKEIFSPEARAELLDGRRGAVDPLDVYRARYAETEGADELRAAPGRRPRHLPGRRPAREDRPREHGALARGARAVLRPGGRRAGARAAAPMKVRGLAKKRLLRRAVATLLPEIVRGRKRGSRSRPPRGCAATWSRSRATCCRRTGCARRASSTRRPSRA